MSKLFEWFSGRNSPQAAASSASPADNIPQDLLDNPLYISDAPPLHAEEATPESEPQKAYAALTAEVDLYGHNYESADELHDVSLSDGDDEPSAAAPPEGHLAAPFPTPLASPPLLSQLLPHDPAAAAASAPSPDSKDAAKDLDEAQAKAAAISLMNFFKDIQTKYENSHQRISDALSALPPQLLYQTLGANKAQDHMQLVRKKAQQIEATVRADKEGVDAALRELKSLQPKDSATFVPQANSLGVLSYLGMGGAALLTGGMVLGGGAVVLSSLAVPLMG